MKKMFVALCVMTTLVLSGCGSTSTTIKENKTTQTVVESPKKENPKKEAYDLDDKASPIDGLSIIVTGIKMQDAKGDRTKDNVANENGEYIANGPDTVRASDYKEITIDIQVENDTDKAISFSNGGWAIKLQDDYKLKQNTKGVVGDQIASHSKKSGTIKSLVGRSLDTKTIILTYNYLNYNDEWRKTVEDYMAGKLTVDEYSKKFKPIPITWKLNVK